MFLLFRELKQQRMLLADAPQPTSALDAPLDQSQTSLLHKIRYTGDCERSLVTSSVGKL